MESGESHKPRKRSLLRKYDIPVEFLDFEYIKKCNDVRMVEKIFKVLRSGEEGFYPDLTKCAEEKLISLQPDSKHLRVETPALTKYSLDSEKREQLDLDMKNWIDDMKVQDQMLKTLEPKTKPDPPIRKFNKAAEKTGSTLKASDRIKSTDYSKWDKFDADAAELKIDLDEERQRELVDLKNKKNAVRLIEEVKDDQVDCLTDFERDHLAMSFKNKGNECYKAKDYEEAIKEYTQSLRVRKTAAAFNNRALICKFIDAAMSKAHLKTFFLQT